MDAKHSVDVFKHLEKQNEILMESYRAMSHELHGLQVEEEILMHKLYQLMSAEGLIKKKEKPKDSYQIDMHKENEEGLCQVVAHEDKEEDSDEEYILPSCAQSDQEDTLSSDD